MKKQTDFIINEAKNAATYYLSQIASFAENLHSKLPQKVPLEWAIVLRMIETKVRQSSGACLSNNEIKQVWEFAQYLITANSDINPQLLKLWELHHEIFKIIASSKEHSGYSPRKFIVELQPRIERADRLAEDMVSAVTKNSFSMLSPTAILLIHVIRTETIEYAFVKQIKDAIQTHNLQNKYDAEFICSVEGKVEKDGKWQTDVRAIRNAIAHGQFKLTFSTNNWEIEFDNNEKGNNYHRKFSSKEFNKFFDSHTLLFKFQWYILLIIELLPILSTHFVLS